jgi:peptide/nickel transport system permease protein
VVSIHLPEKRAVQLKHVLVLRFLIRRVIWTGVLFIAVTLVTYVIFFLAPANPERTICGGAQARPTCLVEVRKELKLDSPVVVQYESFLERLVVHRSLGTSYMTKQSVNTIIAKAAPVTAALVVGGAIVWMVIGLGIGIFSALRPRSLMDRAAMVFVLIGVSAHPIWIGLIFSYVFGVKLGLTPITGYCDAFNAPEGLGCGGLVDWAHHMILPWATFAILFAALYVRMVRANVMETMNEDFVRTARAKGAPESKVMRSHILRNALLPVVTMLGMDIGIALGGAIFTESVYSLPGLGQTAVQAVNNYDLPIVQGVVVFATIAIIVFNLAVDILYAWIDPRIRLE